MQSESQTALSRVFGIPNLQQVKTSSVPPVTLYGPGTVNSCGQQAQARELKHLFVIADSFLHQTGMAAGLTHNLVAKSIVTTLQPCPVGEPHIIDVCTAVMQLYESGCDGVITFGDGSVLDIAKAVALLTTNPDSTLAKMSEVSVLQPRLPLIAIPTTAGTGSEMTNVTVIIDAVSEHKQVLAHAPLIPDMAILGVALTEGVPPHVMAMTDIDALTHTIEAYSVLNATSFTDSPTIGTIVMISESLPKVVGYDRDLVARESTLPASCMAGMAPSSIGFGLCHAMAYQPGMVLYIPHGLMDAILLSTVTRSNRMVRHDRFSQIGQMLRAKKSDDRDVINAVSELIAEVEIGKRLGDVGTTSVHYSARAQAAPEDICLCSNPRTTSLEQIVGLYAAVQQMPDVTLAVPYPADGIVHIGWIRRLHRIRQWHGAIAGCNAYRVLSGLWDRTCRMNKAFTPHPLINNN